MAECSMCGMASVGYKHGCITSLEFTRMTFHGTLQWIPSCWLWTEPRPPLHWNDKHAQVRFKLNIVNFKVLFISYYSSVSLYSLLYALVSKLYMNFVSTFHVYRIWSHEAYFGARLLSHPEHRHDSTSPV